MYSLYKGGPEVLPRKILENLECRKSHLPHFLGFFFIQATPAMSTSRISILSLMSK